MLIKQLSVFGQLALLARSPLFGDSLTNRKTKPYHAALNGLVYVEFIILPHERVETGKGSLTRTMEQCCSMSCRFLPKAIKPALYAGFSGVCNQSRAVNNWTAQIETLKSSDKVMSFDTDSIKIETRLTSFGDIGRLNDQGLAHIHEIIKSSSRHHAYSASWRDPRLSRFGGLVQASVGLLSEAMEAYDLGFMPYGLTREDNLKFRLMTGQPAYSCPYTVETVKGCTLCALACDGSRAISLNNH